MQCNIDARGKAVRLVSGLVFTLIALVLAVMALLALTGPWLWIVAGVVLAIGLFQIYEGRTGWCALCALGFKTPV